MLIDFGFEEDDALSVAEDLLSHFDDETSDEDNFSSGNAGEDLVSHIIETSSARIGHSTRTALPRTQEQPLRNGPLDYPYQSIEVLPFEAWYLRAGDTMELHADHSTSGDFLYIQKIIENIETGQKFLRGLRLRRTRVVTTALDFKLNEVCFVLQDDEDDPRDVFTQGAIEIPVDRVLRPRNLIFSSKNFPQDSFREILTPDQIQANLEELRDRGRLVCRWAWIETFESATKRRKLKASAGCLRKLTGRECTDGKFYNCMLDKVPASRPTTNSRGGSRPGVKRGKYTYGSGFCGAGGDCLGAKWAGLDVRYAWDSDPSACESIRRNFPRTTVFRYEAVDFPPQDFDPHVDILHLSFPCKYFSPNHTQEGKDDEANTTVIFNTMRLLSDAKPIYHTQENTFGLHDRHPIWFNAMLGMISNAGYNVRWKVSNFVDLGQSASRKRLVIYAARRGYPLPNFPSSTHNEHNRRYIYDAIANIPRNASWHLDKAHWFAHPKPSYDARTSLARCICTNGGNNYHPSGQRDFTPRELACLQTFPWYYEFYGSGKTDVVKQIGNALPPMVWSTILKEIVKTMDDFSDDLIDDLGNPIQGLRQAESSGLSTSSHASNSQHGVPLPGNLRPPRYTEASRFSSLQAGPSRASGENVDRLSARTRNLSVSRDIVMIDDEEDDDVVLVRSRSAQRFRSKGDVVDLTKD